MSLVRAAQKRRDWQHEVAQQSYVPQASEMLCSVAYCQAVINALKDGLTLRQLKKLYKIDERNVRAIVAAYGEHVVFKNAPRSGGTSRIAPYSRRAHTLGNLPVIDQTMGHNVSQ